LVQLQSTQCNAPAQGRNRK